MSETTEQAKSSSGFAVPYYEIPFEKFFQFGFSVDCVVFGYHKSKLKVLLIKRGAAPFKGDWALPGDLVYPNERIDVAAKRILRDLTGIEKLFLDQTKTYGQVDRHPAGRVITTGFFALIDISKYDPHAAAWAEGVYWVEVDQLPKLAFDHEEITLDAFEILKQKVVRQLVGFELMPNKFTLGEVQSLYEALLGQKFDKANFRKRILGMNILKDLNEMQENVPHRPGKLYSLDQSKYQDIRSKAINFEKYQYE